MNILLFGCNGQVGWELQRSLAPLGRITALDFDSRSSWCGDFSNLEGIAATVRALQPDVIVNAAAHTAVDKAEAEPELARTLNTRAPAVLAEEAQRCGAWLVHYSTDYVFDGSGDAPRTESDPTHALNVYGATKREGELAVASCSRHIILRTSWVYAARGGNFAKTMLRLAAERSTLQVISDQIGAPTSAELLADVTAHAIRLAQADRSLAGLYHCTAQGETSWHGYAQYALQEAARLGWVLKTTPEQVLPIPTSAYPTAAQRPLNSRLDCTLIQQRMGFVLPDWKNGVTRMITELTGQRL